VRSGAIQLTGCAEYSYQCEYQGQVSFHGCPP
jgi:hypothetical protein